MITLKKKLLLVNIATTGAAVLVSLALLFTMEVRTWKEALVRDMTIKAEIIGSQCTAALAFAAPRDAEEILTALKADHQIMYAVLYDRNGLLFASYERQGHQDDIPPRAAPIPGQVFGSGHLDLTRRIVLDREPVGSISLRIGLDSLHDAVLHYVAGAVLVVALALAVAWMLLTRLQRTVTAPVTDLVLLMEGVSRDQDFSRRASRSGPEELASLSTSFNEMLAAIQRRDVQLEHSLAELQDAYGKLKDLDRMKSEFISTVSHELRTPITAIKAFVEILAIKPNLSEERKRQIFNTINRESDRLARLINDLLDLSRIESGAIQWRDVEADIDDVVRTAVTGILPLAQNKGISVVTKSGAGVPLLSADRDRLMQVVMNLLSNAIKFTPARGMITITTARTQDPEGVSVSVADTGVGIPPEDLQNIFDKFFRSKSDLTSVVEGAGIGLTICRSIVEHYGGSIWATSEWEKGSVFTFTIPKERIAAALTDEEGERGRHREDPQHPQHGDGVSG